MEGKTEALCLPSALGRLRDARLSGFEDVTNVMSNCTILDGERDNFERLAAVVLKLGSLPVILLDGDKGRRALPRTSRDTANVPVIALPTGTEFEQIIPMEDYFAALQEHTGKPELTAYRFLEWVTQQPSLPAQMMFSKKLTRWLDDVFQIRLDPVGIFVVARRTGT